MARESIGKARSHISNPIPRGPAVSEVVHAGTVAQLQENLKRLEQQQEVLMRRRRRDLLAVGIGVSLLVHVVLMWYLATHYRLRPGGSGPAPVSYEFAILQEEELTELEVTELEDLVPEVVSDLDESPEAEAAAELDPAVPAADLEVTAGALPTLGGSGEGFGADGGLAGGGAGTTFFGVSSRGTRFAYIVDRSASMEQDGKMRIAMRELARSVEGLPDFASFYVVLFSSDIEEPPMQRDGWMRAKKSTVHKFVRWLNTVDSGGGTKPLPAFHQVFSLGARPDVIFFLTDGEIPASTAEQVADLNRRGGRVVINTIAFGDARSQDLLKQIAHESGGVYRYVPREGN